MTNKITNVEELMSTLETMRAAQREFATFTQEQVDELFYKAAMAINNLRIPLAQMAVEETGMGLVEDKVIKNHYASEYIYNKYRNEKTCGVLSEDLSFGIQKVAEPVAVSYTHLLFICLNALQCIKIQLHKKSSLYYVKF